MDFRKIANIAVDCVILRLDAGTVNILLTRRTLNMYNETYPVIDDWVLTGNHINKSERLDEAASRIFKEFTGFDNAYMEQFLTFGNPKRIRNAKDLLWTKSRGSDPRSISVAYYFLLQSDKNIVKNQNTCWFRISNLPELGFDHGQIISRAYENLKLKVMSEPVIFNFLPDKFTLNELQLAYESVLDIKIDNRNFRKKAAGKTYIVPLDEKRVGGSKKPAKLYMFSKDVYDRTSAKNNVINI